MKLDILRGNILKLLFDFYPDGIEQQSLRGVYYQYWKIDEIDKAAEFLVDMELVAQTERPHPYLPGEKIIYYKIRPSGITLVEGTTGGCPGILVPGRP